MVEYKMAKPKGKKRIRDKDASGGDPEPDSKKAKVCHGIEWNVNIMLCSFHLI